MAILIILHGHQVCLKTFVMDKLKNPMFFKSNTSAFQLILYQDSFEVVSPLSSAKKKHKVLAVYCSLGNLPTSIKSKYLISFIR